MSSIIVQQLIKDLCSENEEIIKTAAKACYNIYSSDLIPYLNKILKHNSPGVRYFAKRSLFHIIENLKKKDNHEKKETQLFIIKELLNKNDTQEIIKGLRLLQNNKKNISEEIMQILLNILRKTENPYIISFIISLFTIHPYQKSFNVIKRFLKHSDTRIVANAIECMKNFKTPTTIVLLTPFLKSTDNRIKANTINVLRSLSVQGIEKELENMAFSENVWERDSALYVIMTASPSNYVELLSKMLKKEKEDFLIKKIIYLLKKCDSPLAKSSLIAFFQK